VYAERHGGESAAGIRVILAKEKAQAKRLRSANTHFQAK
jgi:hypothetical protein